MASPCAIERSDTIYTVGQLQTLIDFAKSRGIRLINPQFPPPKVCRRIRDKPHIGWCTLLRGPCKCDTNGCLRKEFAEINAKVKERKRQSIEKHNMVATAMQKYITCATRRNEKRDCKPWDCPKCQSYVKVDS